MSDHSIPPSPPEVGLLAQVREAFASDGPLMRADAAYRRRVPQERMALAVAHALDEGHDLVVEAGTGVGKTFAYLVPLLMAGRRALVSTATKTLQDQLFLRDLPRLKALLGVPARLALLKGRASYLCLHRMPRARQDLRLADSGALVLLARVEAWAASTHTGDLGEVEGLDDRSPVIPLVSSTRDNCLGSACPDLAACHLVRARREAMAADIVVVNHHLFFADLVLRDTGLAELLPSVDAAVFDEAHQMIDIGLQFLGMTLSTAQVSDLAQDLLAAGLAHARGLQAWGELAARLALGARQLRWACSGPSAQVGAPLRLRWEERAPDPSFAEAMDAVSQAARQAGIAAAAMEGASPDLERIAQRADDMARRCQHLAEPSPTGHVRWIDLGPQGVRLVESPLDIRAAMLAQRKLTACTWVFTSATLGDDDDLRWFTQRTGTDEARVLKVGSPFDYPAQARVWVPSGMPLPREPDHPAAVGRVAARCASALGGRTFVLTTTLRAMPQIATAIVAALPPGASGLEVLVQGAQPRRALLARFGDGRGRVLVGSHSFWEGVDVPGEALQCVVIDKLPFPPPGDPLIQARTRHAEAVGERAFETIHLAEAALALKQGAGRLIRTSADRGLLVLTDPRVRSMRYGRRLLQALPPMKPVVDEDEAMDWLRSLAEASADDRDLARSPPAASSPEAPPGARALGRA